MWGERMGKERGTDIPLYLFILGMDNGGGRRGRDGIGGGGGVKGVAMKNDAGAAVDRFAPPSIVASTEVKTWRLARLDLWLRV